tara:strand:- start:4810 stop:5958 length:1149 start_codon:yes stop_codon:yes gene_type:complete
MKLIDLGKQPWCNDYQLKKVNTYNLKVNFCLNCQGSQLSYFLKKEKMFSNNYYLSGDNPELINHFQKISSSIKKKFPSDKKNKRNILDIGSNDGTFLKNFKYGWNILGIDPSKTAHKIANKKNIKTIKSYFNYESAVKINKEFDVIHASGVFFHLEDLFSCLKGVKILLKKKGYFVVQFIYLKDLIFRNQFDQIYHEHLYYFTLKSIGHLMSRFDLEIIDVKKNSIHGGSVILTAGHKGINRQSINVKKFFKKEKKNENLLLKKAKNFKNKIKSIKKNLLNKVNYLKKNNYKIYILGAPAKATTAINYFKLNSDVIECCYDINRFKINKNVPGTNIKILNENRIKKIGSKDIFLIMSWNYKYIIIKKFKKKFGKAFKYFLPY